MPFLLFCFSSSAAATGILFWSLLALILLQRGPGRGYKGLIVLFICVGGDRGDDNPVSTGLSRRVL